MLEPDVKFTLEDWHIYPDKSSIERDDLVTHLEPKIMEVLVYLITNANRVVSREELTEKVWQTRFASDEVITRAISVLRKKLCDTGRVHKFIKTIPKHGYILEYDNIEVITNEPLTEANAVNNDNVGVVNKLNKFINPIAAIVIALLAILALLVVLGFQFVDDRPVVAKSINLKIDRFEAFDNLPSSAMVARVLAEQLITTLSNSDATNINLNETNTEQNDENSADFVLGGGVKEIENEYKVNLHFINTSNGNVLWSQSFAGPKGEWHQLVDNICSTIDYFMTVAYKDNLNLSNLSLKSLQAALLVHQAKELRYIGSKNNINLAINMLENASVIYPKEFNVVAELVLSYLLVDGIHPRGLNHENKAIINNLLDKLKLLKQENLVYLSVDTIINWQNNVISLEQAIAEIEDLDVINSTNPEVLTLLADLYFFKGEMGSANKLYNLALNLKPNYQRATLQLAKLHSAQNRNKQAINLIQSYINNYSQDIELYQLLIELQMGIGAFTKTINIVNTITDEEIKSQLQDQVADSYYFLNLPQKSIELHQAKEITANLSLTYKKQCELLMLQGLYEQANTACKQAQRDIDSQFIYARNLLLQGDYMQAKDYYKNLLENINPNFNLINNKYYINEKVDYIWLLALTGEDKKAMALAGSLPEYFADNNRLGYLGYGISDVIVSLALGDKELASEQLSLALNDGWLHWYNDVYTGPHPAIKQLENNPLFEQWVNHIDHSLNLQRAALNVK
ncbi:winged helix-turn-helix domain-containing protein [Thalassomonas sp. M1454]|uniref:winged helix-turn-helix domain-containing protein n=1 Tax=Thalassomonas sp. M1454 TaxID=2594477 RepID=UPI00117E5A8E|nr:winged helix-turn-helix domain-containing protein [Thalassomonas sp. M1454]TRX56783.1 hypothetical protein FNN08_04435 [Thalassomonas sp. M1454]